MSDSSGFAFDYAFAHFDELVDNWHRGRGILLHLIADGFKPKHNAEFVWGMPVVASRRMRNTQVMADWVFQAGCVWWRAGEIQPGHAVTGAIVTSHGKPTFFLDLQAPPHVGCVTNGGALIFTFHAELGVARHRPPRCSKHYG